MSGVVRAELVRLRRPGLLSGWLGLTATLGALVNVVVFQVATQPGGPPANGPGVTFPALPELLAPAGIVSGLAAASSILGVVTLSFWALATSSDYSTGLIRLLVSARPRRWQLVVGKWLALALVTALVTAVAIVATLLSAPAAASAAGLDPASWGTDLPSVLLSAALNLYAALLVWGSLGLVLATLTRSAGIAIGVGIGYVLLLESVLKAAVRGSAEWLPGATIGALAGGGAPDLPYRDALGLGTAYVAVALAGALVAYTRRDVTD